MYFNRITYSLFLLVALSILAGCASTQLDPEARKTREKALLEQQRVARNLEAQKEWDDAADAWNLFLKMEKFAFESDLAIFEAAFELFCMENGEKYEVEVRRARREQREIVRLLNARNVSQAEKRLVKLSLMKHSLPGSGRLSRLVRLRGGNSREEALFRIAECHYRAGRLRDADEAYGNLLVEFPRTEQRDKVIESQFEIGKALIHGAEVPKQFLFIFRWKGESREEGREILDRLIGKYPFATFADSATYYLGIYSFVELKDYDSAEVEFKRLVDKYPGSAWRMNSVFMLGYSHLNQFDGIDYDPEPLESAIEIFDFYLREYPEGNRAKQAKEFRMDAMEYLAQKIFATGEFYERDKKPASAILSFEHILRDFGDTKTAKAAGEKRDALAGVVKQLLVAKEKGKKE